MTPRDPAEEHRVATPLELFFDLVFVVAIAVAAVDLHHGIAEAHAVEALKAYALAFFGIWWAWVNFTWFASAYDTGDAPYRLLVFVMMTGALIFASGASGFAEGDYDRAIWGYVIMRGGLIAQWLRAAANDPERRTTARRYALGVGAVQVGWVGFLYAPESVSSVLLAAFIFVELAIPAWAELAGRTPWHADHIAERYGLMTIIVLGESVLAGTGTICTALSAGTTIGLLPTVAGGLLLLYSMWWLYFESPRWDLLTGNPRAFVWGYVHYLVFASCAAVGAGISVVTDVLTDHAEIGLREGAWAVAGPAAVFVMCLWVLMDLGYRKPFAATPGPVVAALLLLTPLTPVPVLAAGATLALYCVYRQVRFRRSGTELQTTPGSVHANGLR